MSLLALLQTCCLIAFALLLLLGAWQDVRTLHIADAVSMAIVSAFLVWGLGGLAHSSVSLSGLSWSVACAAGVFGVGALAFAAGTFGGGDVKLLTASSLFAGPTLMLDFLTVTVLAGGVLGLAALAAAPTGLARTGADTKVRARLRRGLPYGPAIAAGGLWVAGVLAMT